MDKAQRNMLIITVAGFFIGTAEALIYYNLGENKAKNSNKFTYKIPPAKELLQTASIVMVTSILTAGFTRGIEKALETSSETGNQIEGFKEIPLASINLRR